MSTTVDVTHLSDNEGLKESSTYLQRLFILVLEESSDESWLNLFEFLNTLPQSQLGPLSCLPETCHYILRTLHLLNSDCTKGPRYVRERLCSLFPTLFSKHEQSDGSVIGTLQRRSLSRSTKDTSRSRLKTTRKSIEAPSAVTKLLHYSTETTPITFSAQKMTTVNILNSADAVIEERLSMEKQRFNKVVSLPNRMDLSYAQKHERPMLDPILATDLSPTKECKQKSPEMIKKVPPDPPQDKMLRHKMKMDPADDSKSFKMVTGIDVVHAFAFGTVPCNVQEIYLNYANSVPWDPYDLIVVPKLKKDPTHTIATIFGFLHISPEGHSEHQSFPGWCRDSALLKIVRDFPIFRYYLHRKMITRWHSNIRARKFLIARRKIFNEGFRFHVPFMSALWMINNFCCDLLCLDIHMVVPRGMYDEIRFTENVRKSEKSLVKFLRKFWEYSDRALSNVRLETESRVLELQTRTGHMPFVPEIPISIQKQNHLRLEQDLSDAVQRNVQLDRLVLSSYYVVKANLIRLVQTSVSKWLDIVLGVDRDTSDDDSCSNEDDGDSNDPAVTLDNERAQCLFETELYLDKKGKIDCILSVYSLSCMLLDSLRMVERCLLLSARSPTSSTASSAEAFHHIRGSGGSERKPLTSSPSSLKSTDLLNHALIADIQNYYFVSDAELCLTEAIDKLSSEVDVFLNNCLWIETLNEFLLEWGDPSANEVGSVAPDLMDPHRIESALMSGYIWLDKLSSLPRYFTTSYQLLSISTEVLVSGLVPRLESVMTTLQNNCIRTVHSRCMKLMEMIKRHLEILSCKRYDLEGFAYYAQQLRVMREERNSEHDNLKRSSTLLSSLLSSGVVVSREVKDLMRDTEMLWIDCEIKIKEMEEFVDSQTPLKAQGLQENIESCEQEILELMASLGHPPYTDPSANPSLMMSDLQKIHANALGIQSRLVDLIKWRLAITGHSHDMASVNSAIQHLECRKALWSHKLNFNTTENEWLRIPFKKLDIDEMHKKLQDLLQSLNHLHHYLPPYDPVLEALRKKVEGYHTLIPLLKQLSSKAIKAAHWHTLLAAVEEEYDPSQVYTLNDFILYKLFDSAHTDLIVEVCQSAERESKLKNSLNNLQQRWEQMMLTLQKKSSATYSFALPKSAPAAPTTSKTTKFILSSSQKPLPDDQDESDHLIVAGNTKEILLMLEEDLTELQILKGVAQAESVKDQIEHWNMTIIQLREIVHLLDSCQDKWWNILNLFHELSPDFHQSAEVHQLQSCSTKFQEIMSSIHEDPFVFSLLERRRGQKGFRDLQGDSLQQSLQAVQCMLEDILLGLKEIVSNIAMSCPRFLMLSDWEVLHLNNHHGNPGLVLPSIRQMFPVVSNINTIDVQRSTSNDSSLEGGGVLKEEGYQIVSIEGGYLEWLSLCVPLPIGQRPINEWVNGLDRAIKYSLSCHVTGCMNTLPKKLLGSNTAPEEEDYAVLLWLAENVSQAVVLALECHIGHSIRACFEGGESNNTNNIGVTKSNINRSLNYCTQLIRSVGVTPFLTSAQAMGVIKTLKNIIMLLKHKQDMLSAIETTPTSNMDSLTCILYQGQVETTPSSIGRLGSMGIPSLTGSGSSISQTIPAISRLQNAHDILTSSTKSMASSGPSTGGPPSSSQTKSIKSLVSSVPTTPTHCYIQYGSLWQQYGYEYFNPNNSRLVLTPVTERYCYKLMKGMTGDGGVCLVEDNVTRGEEYAKELAIILGRPLLSVSSVNCMTTITALRSVLLSAIQMGCILSLYGFRCLEDPIRIKFYRLLDDVKQLFDSYSLLITNDKPNNDCLTQKPPQGGVHSTHSLSSSTSLHNRLATEEGSLTSRSNISRGVEPRIDWYNETLGDSLFGRRADIELWGRRLSVRQQYASIIISGKDDMKHMKGLFRSVGIVSMDIKVAIEGYLLSNGFTQASDLSRVLLGCLEDIQALGLLKGSIITASREVIEFSRNYLFEEIRANSVDGVPVNTVSENSCISKALLHYISVECVEGRGHRTAVLDVVLKWFKVAETGLHIHVELKDSSTLLMNAIQRQLEDIHLQKNEELLDKIVQLHFGLMNKQCAILSGGCGSGKTTVYQTLVKAYNSFVNDPLMKGQVQLHVINPAAYTHKEFVGGYSLEGSSIGQWSPGLFPNLLQALSSLQDKKAYVAAKQGSSHDDTMTASSLSTRIEHWVILDGSLSIDVVELVTKLLTSAHGEILPNGTTLRLPENCRIIIESSQHVGDILTPSILPHCIYLHCQSLYSYRDIINTWLKRASTLHNLCITGIEVLSSLMDSTLPSLIQFVTNSSNELLDFINTSTTTGTEIFLTEKFLALLSSVLERNSPKQNDASSRHTASTSANTSRVSSSSRLSRLESTSNISAAVDDSNSTFSIHHDRELTHRPSLGPASLNEHSMTEMAPPMEGDEVLSEASDIDAHIVRSQQYHTSAIYMFTVIWSFGAYISTSCCSSFSDLIRELASGLPTCQNMLPSQGLVFDYYLDLKTYCFNHWNEKKKEKVAHLPNPHYISVPELERFAYICDLYLSYGNNVILIGAPGSGKTSFLKNMVQSRTNSTLYTVSHTLTSTSLHTSIINRLTKLRKRQGGGLTSKKYLSQRNTFLIDDIHLASKIVSSDDIRDGRGSSTNENSLSVLPYTSITELLSMVAEHKILPDLYRYYTHSLKGTQLLATTTVVGTKRLSLKLLRSFNPVPFFPLSDSSLRSVIQRRLTPWVGRFGLEERTEPLCNALGVAFVTVFRNMTTRFSPSPTSPHLLFSLRDLSAVWNGMLLMSAKQQPTVGGGLLGRRGHREGQSKEKRKTTASKTKSGRHSGGVTGSGGIGRRSLQTGRGVKMLPSLTENQVSKPSPADARNKLPRQSIIATNMAPPTNRRMTSGKGLSSTFEAGGQTATPTRGRLLNRQQTIPGGVTGSQSSEQSFLSTSLPIDLRAARTSVTADNEERERIKNLLRGLFRLWCHEVSRVYGDRLLDSKDKIWLVKLIEMCCKYCFCGIGVDDMAGDSSHDSGGDRGVAKRPRPGGRPIRGKGIMGKDDAGTASLQAPPPLIKLQAATLKNDGLVYQVMCSLMPLAQQTVLLRYEELALKGEDLSGLVFAKIPSSLTQNQDGGSSGVSNEAGVSIGSGYNEIGDGQVRDVVSKVLDGEELSEVPNDLSHVVMSRGGMEQVIRLCRALVIPNTHSLLIGPKAVGKRTVTKLAVKLLNATTFELNHDNLANHKAVFRDACICAGAERKKAILLVEASTECHENKYWKYILEIMKEGLISDLFSPSEILIMSKKINSDKLRHTTESAIQGFIDNIKLNLRVVVSWDTPTADTPTTDVFTLKTYHDIPDPSDLRLTHEENRQNLFHSMFQCCTYIDLFQSWTKESYSEVALQFWTKKQLTKVTSINSSDLEALSYFAAHIHLTGVSTIHSILPSHMTTLIGTPGEFVLCLESAFIYLKDLKKQGEDKVQSLHSSLSHLYDIEREVNNLEYKLDSELLPRLEKAEDDVSNHKEIILAAKEKYMASHEKCKKAEETINKETEQVKKLQKLVDIKFEEVAPSYYSSLETLSSIERTVITEVIGYRVPSTHLFPVFEGLCLLFDRPATWDDCHQLMMSPHFYESLRFFDKDGVSQSKLHKLEKLLANQKKICLPRIQEISRAIVPVVLWIAALVDYRKAKAAVQPYRDDLAKAEDVLTSANEVYVTMRYNMISTKEALEIEHSKHKEIMKSLKTARTDVQEVQTRVANLQNLLGSLSNQKKIWEERLTDTQAHLDCLPAESLLIAAMETYCNLLPSRLHLKLWDNWVSYCKGVVPLGSFNINVNDSLRKAKIRLVDNLSLETLLADEHERIGLGRREVFSDGPSLEKALLWRMHKKHCKLFVQVVFDPDNIALRYIRGLYAGEEDVVTVDRFVFINSNQPNAKQRLLNSVKHGYKTIVRIPYPIDSNNDVTVLIHSLLSWANDTSNDDHVLVNDEQVVPHSNLQIFIVLPFQISTRHSFNTYIFRMCSSDVLCNMELSDVGVATILHRHVVEESRRELSIQKWALLADLRLHKRSMLESEDAIMSAICQIDKTQLHNPASFNPIKESVDKIEANRSISLEQVTDTEKGLQDITDKMAPYRQLADYFTRVYHSCRKISRICPQVNITLTRLQSMLSGILNQRDNTKFFLSHSSLPPFLLHLEHTLTLKIHRDMGLSLFPHQGFIFPLLLALTQSELTNDLCILLKEHQTPPILSVLEDERLLTVPKQWSGCRQILMKRRILEKSSALQNLMNSIEKNTTEWNEYFEAVPLLLFPLPAVEPQVSLVEKLTLWKIFKPNKFSEAVQSFISLTLGPEYLSPVPFDPSSITGNGSPIVFCIYKEGCVSNFKETIGALFGIADSDIITISALDTVAGFIDQVSVLLNTEKESCTVMVEHLVLSDTHVEQLTDIFKAVTTSKSHSHSKFFIPIPDTLHQDIRDHLIQWTYHTITLSDPLQTPDPTNESQVLINDFHKLHAVLTDSNSESLDYFCSVVEKIRELLLKDSSSSNGGQLILETVRNDVVLLQSYLGGRESFTARVGHLLSCITENVLPHEWITECRTSSGDHNTTHDQKLSILY